VNRGAKYLASDFITGLYNGNKKKADRVSIGLFLEENTGYLSRSKIKILATLRFILGFPYTEIQKNL